jgi:hypothetical protein
MSDWDDDGLVASVAADYVATYRERAVKHLLSRETIARDFGDSLSADAWLEIACAAARQMRAADRRS